VEHAIIQGELVTLKRVDEQSVDRLHDNLNIRAFYREIGRRRMPTRAELLDDMFDDERLWVWEVRQADDEDTLVGYAGFVAYSGPTYIFYFSLELPVDFDIAQDCFMQLVPRFFRTTEDSILYTYVEKPVDERLDEMLVEGGFDPIDDVPAVDPTEIAVYAMERHTYEAYYGDEESEEDSELEF